MATADQSECFLHLPQELRDMIYEYCSLAQEEPIHLTLRQPVRLQFQNGSSFASNRFIDSMAPIGRGSYIPCPGWPPIAFASKWLVDEILTEYLSKNRFIIGECDTNADKRLNAEVWQRHLGIHASKLRDVTLATNNLSVSTYVSSARRGDMIFEEPGGPLHTRARYTKEGILCFARRAESTDFCVCDILAYPAAEEREPDGNRLLEILKQLGKGWVYTYARWTNARCEACNLPMLEKERNTRATVDGEVRIRSRVSRGPH